MPKHHYVDFCFFGGGDKNVMLWDSPIVAAHQSPRV